jgi:hypothetical protein
MSEAFDWGDPISVYTREQAIADGILVAVPEGIAAEAGFKHPVALTAGLNAVLTAPSASEDYTGRLWDVLSVGLMRFIAEARANRTRFEEGDTRVDYTLTFSGRRHDVYLTVNPYEGFTILLRDED